MNSSNSPSETPLTEMSCFFEFQTEQIEDFDWSRASKDYLKTIKSIPLEEVIDRHFAMMKEFYLWIHFRDIQLNSYASDTVKKLNFEDWKQQQNAF